jgi:hypothetical protein
MSVQGALDPGQPVTDTVYDLTRRDAIETIVKRYAAGMAQVTTRALSRVVTAAIAAGANVILVEPNYIDYDWRSELSAFYSKAFKSYPSATDRLHFLALADGQEPATLAKHFSDSAFEYVGYCVIRPLPWAPVGRTMLRPPKMLAHRVQCVATDIVHLHGMRLEVSGAPFISQDSQLSRCAHAVAWQAAYLHHLRFGSNRVTSAFIAQTAALDVGEARSIPSNGLGRSQLGHVLRAAGVGPIVHNTATLARDGETVGSIISRYVTSGLPVIAANDRHSVLIVGQHGVPGRREYVFHDDERGPYLDTATTGIDAARPWTRVIIPVQPKLYVPGDQAEAVAQFMLKTVARQPNSSASLQRLGVRVDEAGKKLNLQTFPIESTLYKELLSERALPTSTVAGVRKKAMPRWIWVTEALLDGVLLSELIIDGTSNPRSRWILAWLLDGEFLYFNPFTEQTELLAFDPPDLARVVPLSRAMTGGRSNG